MLRRYLKGVQLIKKIIEDNNLQVMATIARYACAYEAIAKQDWWDKSKRRYCPCLLVTGVMYFPSNVILSSCGPVVEQGTRYFLRLVALLWWRCGHLHCQRPLTLSGM